MQLGRDQEAALGLFNEFEESGETLFALMGAAGTGKSMLTSLIIERLMSSAPFNEFITCAPTHKALNVSRRFLSDNGIPFESGYNKFNHSAGTLITGTTAQLLGMNPVIAEDQTDRERKFASVGKGFLTAIEGLRWITVDEVSMLSTYNLFKIRRDAEQIGARVLIIGDPGQLPPVSEKPIDFDKLPWLAEMRQIMRQASDSAIPYIGAAVRSGQDWRRVKGAGVGHFVDPAGAFLDEISDVKDDERDQAVFIAYTNARVNAVQEAMCRKVYGHGRLDVQPGQIVIANNSLAVLTIDKYGDRKEAKCHNGDRLRVIETGESGEWGQCVTLQKGDEPYFDTEFLDEQTYSDPASAFNVELRERVDKARELQANWQRDRFNGTLDAERKLAWQSFFELKESTVLSLSHPFAITSHKAQGSTYRTAFVDARNLSNFDPRALYVASTRPSEELIIG